MPHYVSIGGNCIPKEKYDLMQKKLKEKMQGKEKKSFEKLELTTPSVTKVVSKKSVKKKTSNNKK